MTSTLTRPSQLAAPEHGPEQAAAPTPPPAPPSPPAGRRGPGPRSLGIAVAALLVLAVVAALVVRSSGDDPKATPVASSPGVRLASPDLTLPAAPPGLRIGVITSTSGAGNGAGIRAGSAAVAAWRTNGGKPEGNLTLLVEDDHSDPVAAAAAVQHLLEAGVAGIVYASTGDHVSSGVDVAAKAGVPVLLPYTTDARLTALGRSVFLTGPTASSSAERLASTAKAKGWKNVSVLFDQGVGGQAGKQALTEAGLPIGSATAFDPAATDLAPAAAAATAGNPDAVVIWAGLDATQAALKAVDKTNTSATIVLGPDAATPAFGRLQAGLVDSPATEGVLSVGPWAGAWTPSAGVDAFFRSVQPTVEARLPYGLELSSPDLGAHDAVVALTAAARKADSTKATDVAKALSGSQPTVTGAPLDFSRQQALRAGDVALLTYTVVDDGSGRFADAKTKGGHWVAVAGTYDVPSDLKGIDDPFGG